MPMHTKTFHFEVDAPSEPMLIQLLRTELGHYAFDEFDSIDVEKDRVQFTSMNLIAIVYAAKVCQRLGGSPAAPGSEGKAHRVPIPSWAVTPWIQHSWFTRLKIKWGRIKLA